MSTLAFALGIAAMFATLCATIRLRHPAELAFAYMMIGWMAGELAVFNICLQATAIALLAWAGALDTPFGVVGEAALAISIIGLIRAQIVAGTAAGAFERGLADGLGEQSRDTASPPRRSQAWRPFHFDHSGIEVVRDVPYCGPSTRNLLDVYRTAGTKEGDDLPVIIYVHGGAWTIGDKAQQGKPMLLHLARRGFVGVSVNYRLAPKDRWPAQIVDVKRAIAWVREHIADYGGDPSFIAISGSSAGGHLSMLAALTPGDAAFQPGFEHADTSVDACVPIYAPFDLTDSAGLRGRAAMRRFLEQRVFTTRLADDRHGWRNASPLFRVNPVAPPTFVIQGRLDELVWVEETRAFVAALSARSTSPVVFVEVPGAQHAFEVFNSVRSREAVDSIARFLVVIASRQSASRRTASS